MHKSTLVMSLLVLTSFGGAVLAWRQHAELVELRAGAQNRNERAEWQRKVGELETLNRQQRERLAGAGAKVGPLPRESGNRANATATREEPEARARAGSVQQQTAAIKELTAKPEIQALLNAQKKVALEQRYADLFKRLNLPPEQIDKLKALLEERTSTMQDLFTVAREQGINLRANPEAYKQLVADTQNQINANLKAAIGERAFDQLTNYDRTIPQRNLVSDLEQRLSYSGAPLSPTQAEQLVQILAANPAPRPTAPATIAGVNAAQAGTIVRTAMQTVPGVGQLLGVTDDSGRSAIPGYPISPAALGQAQTVLSPPQLAALQQVQQLQQAQQQLKQLVTETLVKHQPPNPAPAPERKGGGG